MIYFVGGAPRIGKSIIAQSLAKNIKILLFATDNLVVNFKEKKFTE
ncbi:MAG: hypothetical protein HY817_03420 [Candidatus Abawacabacteria bacterium]|nr:hypothetical protein [Candidatus Abawacabacteria bacterium]